MTTCQRSPLRPAGPPRGEAGAALVVGLILLLVLTLLAISGMTTASLETADGRQRSIPGALVPGCRCGHRAGTRSPASTTPTYRSALMTTWRRSAWADADARDGTSRSRQTARKSTTRPTRRQCEYFMRSTTPVRHDARPRRRLQHRHGLRGLSLHRRQLRHVGSRRAVGTSTELLHHRTGRRLITAPPPERRRSCSRRR